MNVRCAGRLWAAFTVILLLSGCANWGPLRLTSLPKETAARLDAWIAGRSGLASVAALADVTVLGQGGVLPGGLLTATFRRTMRAAAPPRTDITLFSQEGTPLLRYTETGGRFTLIHTGDPTPRRGTLLPAATTRGQPKADPVALALDGLGQLLSAAAGIDLSGGRVGVTRDGQLAVTRPAGTVRFSLADGNLVSLSIKRPHSAIGPVDLSFADWRPMGETVYPYGIDAAYPNAGVSVLVDVVEWAVEKSSGTAGAPIGSEVP